MQDRERTSPWIIAFRVIFTLALLGCIVFIFRNSIEPGQLSSLRSRAVMEKINALLSKVHINPLAEHTVRKLAHFMEFALEGFLLMFCLRVYTSHFVRHISWPLLAGLCTALTDETIQRFIPERTSSVIDVWLDMSGVVAGAFAAFILLMILRAFLAYYKVKKENNALRAEREKLLREQRETVHERLVRRAQESYKEENG